MHKELSIGKYWIHYGYSFKHFGLGFTIDKWHLELDLVFFWVGIEW